MRRIKCVAKNNLNSGDKDDDFIKGTIYIWKKIGFDRYFIWNENHTPHYSDEEWIIENFEILR